MEIFNVIFQYLILPVIYATLFQFFKSPGAQNRGDQNPALLCGNCAELQRKLQEKHELIMTLMSKGNDVQKQLQESQEKEADVHSDVEALQSKIEEFIRILNRYEEQLYVVTLARKKCQQEMDITSQHLQNLEIAFTDVHCKYEKAKNIIESSKRNETALLEAVAENKNTILNLQNSYDELKEESTTRLQIANETISNTKQNHCEELNRYKAKIQALEIKSSHLEENLKQKAIENEKLSSICDQFVCNET